MEFVKPSKDEQKVVDMLFDKLHQESQHKITKTAILRFYRGQQHNEEQAHKCLLAHLKWRQDNHIDDIKEDDFKNKYKTGKILAEKEYVDLKNHPMIVIFPGKHHTHNTNLDELKKMVIYFMEQMLKRADSIGERVVICFNMDGFKLTSMDYDVVKLFISVLQDNYPDTLYVCYIINSPFIFKACWSMIKMWMDPITLEKIKFIHKDELINYFPENVYLWLGLKKK